MEVSLIEKFSIELDKTTKSIEFRELTVKLETYFKDKNYGDDIYSYLIGIICVHPNYDQFLR